jgi:hypothetical protein
MTVDGALAAQLKDIVGRQEVSIDRSQAVVIRLQADNSVLLARVHELEASLAGKSQLLSADVVCRLVHHHYAADVCWGNVVEYHSVGCMSAIAKTLAEVGESRTM